MHATGIVFTVSNCDFSFYFAQPLSDVVMHVERGYRMDPPDGCPSEVYEIMKEVWNLDAHKRPTFKEVLSKLDKIRAATV